MAVSEPIYPSLYIGREGDLYRLNSHNRYQLDPSEKFHPGADANSYVMVTLAGRLYFPEDETGFALDGQVIVDCVKLHDKDEYLIRTASKRLYHLSGNRLNVALIEENIHKLIGFANGFMVAYLRDDGLWRAVLPDKKGFETKLAAQHHENGERVQWVDDDDLQPHVDQDTVIRGTVICNHGCIIQLTYSQVYEDDHFQFIEGSLGIDVASELDEGIYEDDQVSHLLAITKGNLHLISDEIFYSDSDPQYPELGPWVDIIRIDGRAYPLSESGILYCSFIDGDDLYLRKVTRY